MGEIITGIIIGVVLTGAGVWWGLCRWSGTVERYEREDFPAFSDSDSRTVRGIHPGQKFRSPR